MENNDSAMLHNKAMIVSNLSMLVKHKCMISANLGGKDVLLTALIAINHKENTLILDYSSSDYLNKKLVNTSHVEFSTGFNGIQVAFSGEKITKITYKGDDAFVMPIPSALYWFNRREYYRVNTPITKPSSCVIKLKTPQNDSTDAYFNAYSLALNVIRHQQLIEIQNEIIAEQQAFNKAYAKMSVESKIKAKLERQKIEAERAANPVEPDENLKDLISLHLHDISLSGFSMTNDKEEFSFFLTEGGKYEDCKLIMPNHGEVNIAFEIMVQRKVKAHKAGEFAEFIGVKFSNLKASSESIILRYIQDLERQSGVLNI